MNENWTHKVQTYDERRDIAVPGDLSATIQFCRDHFLSVARQAILNQGYFAVALSGGSTPKAIFKTFTSKDLDWSRVLLFWSDERNVAPTQAESNFKMAMDAGFSALSIPSNNIFRMKGESEDLEAASLDYENLIKTVIPKKKFDLVMLGMGEDGHTASLFPYTHGLHAKDRLVIANYVPQLNAWRLTLTYECINSADHIVIYLLGANKATILANVLAGAYDPDHFPIQKVGTPAHKALWIVDQDAASLVLKNQPS